MTLVSYYRQYENEWKLFISLKSTDMLKPIFYTKINLPEQTSFQTAEKDLHIVFDQLFNIFNSKRVK